MIIGETGTLAGTLGTVQPFRYRGDVYDEETGLYYLRSRYYQPEWCRFVNADSILSDGGMGATNVLVYCNNCPVSHCDLSGAAATTALNITDAETARSFAKLIELAVGQDHVGNSYTSFRFYKQVNNQVITNAEQHNSRVDNFITAVWNASNFYTWILFAWKSSFVQICRKLFKKNVYLDFFVGLSTSMAGNSFDGIIVDTLASGFHVQNGGYNSYFVEYRMDYKFLFFIPMSNYGVYEIREYCNTDNILGITTYNYEVWYQYFDSFGNITPVQKIGEMVR